MAKRKPAKLKSTVAALAEAYKARKQAEVRKQRQADDALMKQVLASQRLSAQETARQRNEEVKQAERDQRRREREAEAARRRKADEVKRAMAEMRKEADRIDREAKRRTEEAEKKRSSERHERQRAEAVRRTGTVERRVAELGRVLRSRSRRLSRHRPAVAAAIEAGGANDVADLVAQVLASSAYLDGFPQRCEVAYVPAARELYVVFSLPPPDVVPAVARYTYIKARGVIEPVARKAAEAAELYAEVVAGTALRAVGEAFAATPSALVDSVVLDGRVTTKDRSTGRPTDYLLVSVNATRDQLASVDLDNRHLHPADCLRGHLKARVSDRPYNLDVVPQMVAFDLASIRRVGGMEPVGPDTRLDLLAMDPFEFEDLVTRLFQKMGYRARTTAKSRDDGFDIVVETEGLVIAGTSLVQVKRYQRPISVTQVRELVGAMKPIDAMKGIFVTTSWFTKPSRDFAANANRVDLIEGHQLRELFARHLGLNVLIDLPRLPPGQ